MKNQKTTLTFRTETQAALFHCELSGQISDGHWENASPQDHWIPWGRAEVQVGPFVGRNFGARKDNYNFSNKDLLEVVEQRMIGYARLARKFGFEFAKEIDKNGLIECETGRINWDVKGPGRYWDEVREALSRLNRLDIDAALSDTSYGHKELMLDLKEMKAAIKNFRSEEVSQ